MDAGKKAYFTSKPTNIFKGKLYKTQNSDNFNKYKNQK